ncbi:hypothetical protein [Actinoplanes palleronii]|uniref:Uncharacterized protein n=1 Tax=Actinoplanes palleronii TaxID=113570 RepID=A0ABQ4BJ94_9ACTN|nr:hypothetical protein [Actinoplanes palleronii]GIE70723.1 hypothetical protein Apa02nite_068310 [Actinoplanes palleronii]
MTVNASKLATEILRGKPPQGAPSAWVEPAVVASVSAGAAADGNALTTVTWRGTAIQAAYLASYTPTAGHTVAVLYQPPGGLLILGRIIGTPPS